MEISTNETHDLCTTNTTISDVLLTWGCVLEVLCCCCCCCGGGGGGGGGVFLWRWCSCSLVQCVSVLLASWRGLLVEGRWFERIERHG